jgi:hypothetical protein
MNRRSLGKIQISTPTIPAAATSDNFAFWLEVAPWLLPNDRPLTGGLEPFGPREADFVPERQLCWS